MIWPFGKSTAPKPKTLPFKDNEAFFHYQCQFGQTELMPKRGVVAIVLDARLEFEAEESVKVRADGTQVAVIRVASIDGGFKTMADTAGPGRQLKVGDVVIWVPLLRNEEFPMVALDERAAWMGLIAAVVAPEINPYSHDFTVLEQFG